MILRIEFTIHFHPKNLKCKEKPHDLIHDLSFYWTSYLVPEFIVLGIYNFDQRQELLNATIYQNT